VLAASTGVRLWALRQVEELLEQFCLTHTVEIDSSHVAMISHQRGVTDLVLAAVAAARDRSEARTRPKAISGSAPDVADRVS
jgi:hypothetical protein